MSPTTIRHSTNREFITILTHERLYSIMGPEEARAVRERAEKLEQSYLEMQDRLQKLVLLVGED